MASTNSSGIMMQPTSCAGEDGDSNCDGELTFVDFLPQCQNTGGLDLTPVYETFRELVDRANHWLQVNRNSKVVTCESVVFKDGENEAEITDKMIYKVRYPQTDTMGDPSIPLTHYIRGLRLWLSERKEEAKTPQQIGYRTLLPRRVHPRFETLDEVLRSFNSSLQSSSMSGPIINVETQVIKMPSFREIDPERSHWKARFFSRRCLCVIRVYYELMAGNPEEIGVKDFIPDRVSEGGIFSLPEYVPFADVVGRASDWCSAQQGLRICNIQTVELKIRECTGYVDTQKMSFTERGTTMKYLRILRVAYTRARETDASGIKRPNTEVTQLTYRTFEPIHLKGNLLSADVYETLQQTKSRMTTWLKATGARVISAETLAIRDSIGLGLKFFHHEDSFPWNDREQEEVYWLFVIRLYFNGAYREPPPDTLPPVPELKHHTGCCVLS